MTQITRDYILQQIDNIKQQRVNALAITQQAEGVLMVYNDLLQRIDTQDDVAAPQPAAPIDVPIPEDDPDATGNID